MKPQKKLKTYLAKCIGIRRELSYQQGHGDYGRGDVFLLCTDGLYRKQPDAEMEKMVRRSRGNMAVVCRNLVDGARKLRETDNITVAAVRII